MTIDFEHAYRAVAERDGSQDGRFVTAVKTTGVYCRPSCPARTPLAPNVSFYATTDEARAAGYRACRRCHP
ncbi:MAG: Ada metal-binding domain-containing protein [Solirubrobacteraceae bacterium]